MSDPIRIGCQFGPFKGSRAFLDVARRLEDEGYDVATVPDHFGGWASVWPSIAAIAGVTSTLRVGTLTINNDLWNPVVLARDAVSADQLSDGRLELGLGAGWRTADYEFTGIHKDPASERIARLGEAIEVLRAYFGPGEVDHDGRHYRAQVPDARLRPVQERVPIFIGGGGRKILRLAATHADILGVHINLKAGAFSIGTGAADPDQGVVSDSLEERLEWVRSDTPAGRDTAPLQLFFMEVRASDDARAAAESVAPTFGVSPDDVLASPYFLTGPPQEMAEKLQAVSERYGIGYFTCREDHIETMSSVIALLRT